MSTKPSKKRAVAEISKSANKDVEARVEAEKQSILDVPSEVVAANAKRVAEAEAAAKLAAANGSHQVPGEIELVIPADIMAQGTAAVEKYASDKTGIPVESVEISHPEKRARTDAEHAATPAKDTEKHDEVSVAHSELVDEMIKNGEEVDAKTLEKKQKKAESAAKSKEKALLKKQVKAELLAEQVEEAKKGATKEIRFVFENVNFYSGDSSGAPIGKLLTFVESLQHTMASPPPPVVEAPKKKKATPKIVE